MDNLSGFEIVVVLAVILSRLIVPLFIIRFPLPAIIACLVIDAVDQTVFQTLVPDAELAGYQSYDKALDIYYLVIAYISTFRNWTNQFAVYAARFLIFYRLAGVVLFELGVPLPDVLEEVLGERGWLFIFPNTFEYFFIFYEAVRLFWDPRRMSPRVIIGGAAFIWIFIKLPQEWWIHVAQLDMTDFVQEDIFGVAAGTAWIDTFLNRPWIVVIAVVVVALLLYAAYWLMQNKLPPRDRPLTIDADAEPGRAVPAERLAVERRTMAQKVLRPGLLEKVVLIALVSTIFGSVLQVRSDALELALTVIVVVVANGALSTWLARRGFGPVAALRQFLATGLLNVGILLVLLLVLGGASGESPNWRTLGFFLLLITLLITLYDRYRPEYRARFAPVDPASSVITSS